MVLINQKSNVQYSNMQYMGVSVCECIRQAMYNKRYNNKEELLKQVISLYNEYNNANATNVKQRYINKQINSAISILKNIEDGKKIKKQNHWYKLLKVYQYNHNTFTLTERKNIKLESCYIEIDKNNNYNVDNIIRKNINNCAKVKAVIVLFEP